MGVCLVHETVSPCSFLLLWSYRYLFLFPVSFRLHVKLHRPKRALRRCIGGKCLGPVDGLKLRQTCAWPLVLKMPEFDFSQVVAFRESFLTFRMAPEARTDACLPNHYPPRARVHSLVHSLGRRLFFLSLEKREQRITCQNVQWRSTRACFSCSETL